MQNKLFESLKQSVNAQIFFHTLLSKYTYKHDFFPFHSVRVFFCWFSGNICLNSNDLMTLPMFPFLRARACVCVCANSRMIYLCTTTCVQTKLNYVLTWTYSENQFHFSVFSVNFVVFSHNCFLFCFNSVYAIPFDLCTFTLCNFSSPFRISLFYRCGSLSSSSAHSNDQSIEYANYWMACKPIMKYNQIIANGALKTNPLSTLFFL